MYAHRNRGEKGNVNELDGDLNRYSEMIRGHLQKIKKLNYWTDLQEYSWTILTDTILKTNMLVYYHF